jgi:hypothetical protein
MAKKYYIDINYTFLLREWGKYVSLLVLLSFNTVYAQFKVNKNTEFSVHHVLSSKEGENIIGSSFLGKGVFYLNQTNQQLVTKTGVTFNTLRIADASELVISTSLIVNDLIVDRGNLNLTSSLKVHGELYLSKTVTVKNRYFLQFQRSLDSLNSTVPLRYSIYKVDMPYQTITLLEFSSATAHKLNSFNCFESFTSQYCKPPLSPPPKG